MYEQSSGGHQRIFGTQGEGEEFLMWWYEMKEGLIDVCQGTISCRLHRSLDADAEFQFVNVVEWQNSLYSQAYENSISLMKAKLAQSACKCSPCLRRLITIIGAQMR